MVLAKKIFLAVRKALHRALEKRYSEDFGPIAIGIGCPIFRNYLISTALKRASPFRIFLNAD